MGSVPSITIVGIGPGNPGARTIAARQALDEASSIVLRTAIHPGIEDLIADPRVVACDDLYESSASFDETYQSVCDRVIDLSTAGPVVYVVPGSPLFGERTVQMLRDRADDMGILLRFIPAVSALDEVAAAAGIDLLSDQPQLIDALELVSGVAAEPFSGGQVRLDPSRHLIVSQLFDRQIASEVKHALSRVWPEDHSVTVVRAAGTADVHLETMPLSELDHVEHDHLTSLVLPPLPWLEATASPITLFRIIAMLRSPEGCPWDRKQTHRTLADKVIEEAHEVSEAIAEGDTDALRDELGDLLLLVALCAQIAEEAGEFTIEDVFRAVNSKLVRRHPHVFGDVVAETPEDVLATWKRVKATEKAESRSPQPTLRYDQLPRSMSVIERIRRAESDVPGNAGDDTGAAGVALLAIIETALSAGIDPEAALERAYRNARSDLASLEDKKPGE